MNRSTALLVIAIVLVGFGVYRALYVPAMLIGPGTPLLLLGFVLQAVCGIAAGIGVWRGAAWAPLAIVLLGASAAATELIEGFLLQIIGWLVGLLRAVIAIVVTLLLALYVRARP